MGKRTVTAIMAIMLCPVLLWTADPSLLKNADDLYWGDRYDEVKSLLADALSETENAADKAEILWRLSRTVLAIGDELKVEGASDTVLFATYEEAETYADQAIELAPLAQAYVYRAASIGRWGETKGPLNALSKADSMKEDLAHVVNDLGVLDNSIAWYALGQLYFQLPGWPISYGNLNAAVSYTRKALDTIPSHALYPGHYKSLAEMLWKRNWNSSKRKASISTMQKEWDKSGRDELSKHWYYEGAGGASTVPFYSPVALHRMSDRQEAVMLLQYAVNTFAIRPFNSRSDMRNYDEIQSLLKDWGF